MHRPAGIVTLTTDFGSRDGYAAAVKGVVLSICPRAVIVDVTHDVAPRDVAEGAFVLSTVHPHFPDGTIHVAVVDPGVGTPRRALVVETDRALFVGPDNGLFTPVLDRERVRGVFAIESRRFVRASVSATFHGRDVFAPAAAHLAAGQSPGAMGPACADPVRLPLYELVREEGALRGRIVHVDRFGNAITNIPAGQVRGPVRVEAGGRLFDRVQRTYGEAPEGQALALVGSVDTLEIAVNGGSAAEMLGLSRGDEVVVLPGGGKGERE